VRTKLRCCVLTPHLATTQKARVSCTFQADVKPSGCETSALRPGVFLGERCAPELLLQKLNNANDTRPATRAKLCKWLVVNVFGKNQRRRIPDLRIHTHTVIVIATPSSRQTSSLERASMISCARDMVCGTNTCDPSVAIPLVHTPSKPHCWRAKHRPTSLAK
jgi:hypothetical protein